MTIGLTYNNDLSRVQIALSALPFDEGTVRIERSTNEMFWQTVRGGAALSVSGGAASLDDFEFAADVENFYRAVTIDPEPGLLLPGASGDYASTPDHASLDITGDIVLTVDATLDDWQSSVQQFESKWSGTDQRSYALRVNADGTLRLSWTTAGTGTNGVNSTDAIASDAGRLVVRGWLDVDSAGTDHRVLFYTSPTGEDGTFELFGNIITNSGTTSIFSSTATVNVGAHSDGTSDLLTGTVHSASIWSGNISGGDLATGTLVADPVFEDQATGATSFTDDAGRLWTINGNAEIVGEVLEADSITPSLAGQIWLKSVRHPFLNVALPRVLFRDPSRSRVSRSTEFPVSGRSVGVAVSDVRLGQRFIMSILTEDEPQEFARNLDLTVASGDIFFIHVPAGHPAPGGYVIFGDSNDLPITGHSESPHEFTLPCTVVAQPGPDIVGGTMTYGALLNLYGGYNNVLAANPTYAALLDLMASPDDLVVL